MSPRLTEFWGRPVEMRCAVIAPPARAEGRDDALPPPVCYIVHGFGESHRFVDRHGPRVLAGCERGELPRLLYVYLDASCRFGHHGFADGVNNGPRGAALVQEFIPAIEARFGGLRPPGRRFVTGHSSGGWSALWLQVTYPDEFGGCWATGPDSADFRDFSGVDLYAEENLYRDAEGRPRPLIVQGGTVRATFEQYVTGEIANKPVGGQFFSFDAVFGPRGEDGRPMPMFDRATGAIDPAVVEAWKRYDIGLILRTRWADLGPRLAGKIHLWCGEEDTFLLDGAARLLQRDLAALGSDADVLLVPGRDHGSLFHRHDDLWPKGMEERIYREMEQRGTATIFRATAAQGESAASLEKSPGKWWLSPFVHSHPHEVHHDEYATDAADRPAAGTSGARLPHALLHPGGGDPSVCVCSRVQPHNGWCDRCAVGYVGGVPIRSELLFETLDPHGHEIGHDSLTCPTCKAMAATGGWCSACRIGWHRGVAWMTRITWTFAHGEWIDGSTPLCPRCRAVADADPPRAGAWCAACGSGAVGRLRFTSREFLGSAAGRFGTLEAALAALPRCEMCACAIVADDQCPTCRIAYRDGVAVEAPPAQPIPSAKGRSAPTSPVPGEAP